MPRLVVIVSTVLLIAVIFVCECAKEPFKTFSEDICSSINTESALYTKSPADLRLKVLCASPETINPDQTCTVGCDIQTLCRNPGVGFCGTVALFHKLTCDVSRTHYGEHPHPDLPRVYRVRKGTCLSTTNDGRVVEDTNLRACLMRFPSRVSVVGASLTGDSNFLGTWTVTLDRRNPGTMSLPLATTGFATACAAVVGYRAPAMYTFESSRTPSEEDTSSPDVGPVITNRLKRAATQQNQPKLIHVTARFTCPVCVPTFGGKFAYVAPVSGTHPVSPFSKMEISVRTKVWVCMTLSPKEGKIVEVREIMEGSDGKTRIYKSATPADFDMTIPVSSSGDPPELWLGLRDGAADHGY